MEKRQQERGFDRTEEAQPQRHPEGKNPHRGKVGSGRTFRIDLLPEEWTANCATTPTAFSCGRLIDGRAVLVAYHIGQSGGKRGRVHFALPYSEFGLEFVLTIA